MQLQRYSQRRINLVAGAILIAVAVLVGVIAFYVMQRQVEGLLRHSLQTSLQSRVQWIRSEIDAGSRRMESIASRPFLIEQLRRVDEHRDEAGAVRQLKRYVLPALLQSGVSGVAIFDADGRELTRAGELVEHPELSVPLTLPGHPTLLWQAGLRMQIRAEVRREGKLIGRLVAQTPLPAVSASFLAASPLGRTTEQAMCAPSGSDMRCFPMTLSPRVTTFPKRSRTGVPLPMTHALEGKTGIVQARDYRQQNVIAAFSPIGGLGLGMVLKMDSAELYAPVWDQLRYLLPATAAMLVIALLLLRWQLTPLVAGLARSERQAREALDLLKDSEQRVQAVLENVDEGIITFSTQGTIELFNPGAERMFGRRGSEVEGRSVAILMPEASQPRIEGYLDQLLSSALATGLGGAREVTAQRADGEQFPMELRVSEFILEGHRQFIGIVRDISERKASEARISHLAHYDALTDLPNRGLVRDRVQQAIAAARRAGSSFAVMFLDLDKFKHVNDSFGHDVGDALLQLVAARLTGTLRAEDTVGRQGGDEFIVLLPGLGSAADAAVVAQKLLGCLAAPLLVNGRELRSSASIGIAMFPQDGDDVDTLLKHSDTAMYHAKDVGRGNYQYFAREMNAAAAERLLLEGRLLQAIEHDELQLYYQPLADIGSGRIVGLEALVRWNHPRLGLLAPGRFIAMAEDTGLIVPLGEWVLRRACEQLRQWRQQGIRLERMVVNLSPRQFREKNLLATFSRILGETGIDPHWLGLEITESVIMENPEGAIEVLRGLKALGIEISLDDFGTGYSSLSYLKRFPIDKLKIDQSFVRDLGSDADDAAMVAAIIVMAHQLHIRVVAEGVETQAQLAFLRERGCDEYQGFLFSRPLPASELDERLIHMQAGTGIHF